MLQNKITFLKEEELKMKGNIYGMLKRKLPVGTIKIMDSLEGVEPADILLVGIKLQYASIMESIKENENAGTNLEENTKALNNLKTLICEYEQLKSKKDGLDMEEQQARIESLRQKAIGQSINGDNGIRLIIEGAEAIE